ncbi:hypothetical protein BDC45DRAFT_574349 [Circinella umbellata]|nr:hypothetical protein BDC45DRAFT_574349 [Circinella umbellata]
MTETLPLIEEVPSYLHNPPSISDMDDYFDWVHKVLRACCSELIKPVLHQDFYCSRIWCAFAGGEYDDDPLLV